MTRAGDYFDKMERRGAPLTWAQQQNARLLESIDEVDLLSERGPFDLARFSSRLIACNTTYTEGVWANLLALRNDMEDIHGDAVGARRKTFALLIAQTLLLAAILWRVW